jgi:hypothetical protein
VSAGWASLVSRGPWGGDNLHSSPLLEIEDRVTALCRPEATEIRGALIYYAQAHTEPNTYSVGSTRTALVHPNPRADAKHRVCSAETHQQFPERACVVRLAHSRHSSVSCAKTSAHPCFGSVRMGKELWARPRAWRAATVANRERGELHPAKVILKFSFRGVRESQGEVVLHRDASWPMATPWPPHTPILRILAALTAPGIQRLSG